MKLKQEAQTKEKNQNEN